MTLKIGVVVVAASVAVAAQTWKPPRTPDGRPDLQGIWTNASITPLERPKELGAKEFFTEDEAAEVRKKALVPADTAQRGGTEAHYEFTQFGLDRTQAPVAYSLRTSMIVGPDGHVPPLLPEARDRNQRRQAALRGHEFDGPETRGIQERCIIWGNEGPPMLPPGYNSFVQIVQTPAYVMIMQEMIHDARIIPLDGRPHAPAQIRRWLGDSIGRWDGDTLVVDTTNFPDTINFRGAHEHLHVVERFTRTAPDVLSYEATIADPQGITRTWKISMPLYRRLEKNAQLLDFKCVEFVEELMYGKWRKKPLTGE